MYYGKANLINKTGSSTKQREPLMNTFSSLKYELN